MDWGSSAVLALPRSCKRGIALFADLLLAYTSTWLAIFSRLGVDSHPWQDAGHSVYFFAPLFALPIFVRMGLYRAIFRYTGGRAIWTISKACFLYFLLFAALLVVIKLPDTPRSVGLIQPAFFFILVLASRAAVGFWLGSSYKLVEEGGRKTKRKALIFGAGHAGRQSAAGFANNPEYEIVGFLDDDPKLHHLQISGLSVYSRAQLPTLIQHKGVEDVLVAISTVGRKQKQDILNFLLGAKVRVRILPSLTDLADGKVTVQEFRDVAIDDLLGREAVQPDDLLLSKNIAGKVVAVTGAGGSIGSELCRQILRLQPQRLLLIERTEFALYNIHQELEKALKNFGGQVQIIPLLASVQSKEKMLGIFKAWKPHTVYHAAAYKHVPMVEMNAAAGVQNNVFGTLYTAQAAQQAGVENFVLISTDKAVRPTNIMGASKRIAELSLQALHSSQEHFAPQLAAAEAGVVETTQAALQSSQRIRLQGKTCFSMVRFGNVLGSSGSVIPLFRSQIQNGEAITLTHQDVTRYFMSIPEAAQLVIQAGAMAKGGEVFVLDMGEPVRIYDLAERLIQLSGLSVKNEANPHGDIEIRVTGLRPGEKLYEELLIGDNPEPTSHSRIMKAHEAFLEWDELQEHLKQLKRAIHCNDLMTIYQQLQMLVSGYRSSAQIVDLLYSEFGESTSRDDSEAQNLLDGVQRGL